eukprot:2917799-Pyramimonas_sp.AAC.1
MERQESQEGGASVRGPTAAKQAAQHPDANLCGSTADSVRRVPWICRRVPVQPYVQCRSAAHAALQCSLRGAVAGCEG